MQHIDETGKSKLVDSTFFEKLKLEERFKDIEGSIELIQCFREVFEAQRKDILDLTKENEQLKKLLKKKHVTQTSNRRI